MSVSRRNFLPSFLLASSCCDALSFLLQNAKECNGELFLLLNDTNAKEELPQMTDEECNGELENVETCAIRYVSEPIYPTILSMKDLASELPNLSRKILNSLGSQNLKSMYQNCLVEELKQAEVVDIQKEVTIPILYNNSNVGSRQADLILQLRSEERVLIELKAVKSLKDNYITQLQLYMNHFKIDVGFLINFGFFVDNDASFEIKELTSVSAATSETLTKHKQSSSSSSSPSFPEVIQFNRNAPAPTIDTIHEE
jgi:GxxExxY protein